MEDPSRFQEEIMRLVMAKIVNVFERPSPVQGRGGQEEQEEAGGGGVQSHWHQEQN